ncbi:MAG: O-antigen ligase family protein [Cryomorphaceae bacterium]|nr:O-antigen ligase family protein [Flavobacteriales bacterium]
MTFDLAKEVTRPRTIIATALLFSIANGYAIYREFYLLSLLPVALILGWVLIYRPKYALLFIALGTPLSVNFENISALGGIGISLPTEPVMVALMLLYLLRLATGGTIDKRFIRHPLTVAISFSLLWMLITSLTSQMPVVSFKFFLARLWFVITMYFMISAFFSREKFLKQFGYLLMIGMSVAIIYTIVRHAQYNFAERPAHWVMTPLFSDHTSYGALIAIFFPMVIFHFWRAPNLSFAKLVFGAMFILFCVGLILSYTRAAWVSLAVALPVFVLIRLKIDFKLVLLAAAAVVGLFFAFEDTITHQLSKNSQDSSGDFREHVQSITNISSDASNLERFNRWNAALRMYSERPITGFGPGTYMFQYAVYQKSADKTIISTNQADGGNAHSEYLGPLSEQGLPGALLVVVVFALALVTGIRLYYQLDHAPYTKGMVLCMVLGLVTYFIHGVLNNFLDTDKASVPVWGFMSAFVAIQIYRTGADYLNRQQSNAVSSK